MTEVRAKVKTNHKLPLEARKEILHLRNDYRLSFPQISKIISKVYGVSLSRQGTELAYISDMSKLLTKMNATKGGDTN